ncbi:MAG TPA: glycosyltransferase family 2 protein [Smithellaceae bacterium]|nr:glycosyltransferase family 2 protein [Smithellaceae bacterium]
MPQFRKLIIQIPCYNESGTIGLTLRELPRHVAGFGSVEWLIIDDGSTDGTVEAAMKAGADHIVRVPRNRGLANAFMTGLEASLKLGADVVVNTDADNQYNAEDIPALVKPILEGRADIVVGARSIGTIEHFSPMKKILQKIGSTVVRFASNTDVVDAPSGFRAMSREAALRINVFNDYTYTLETIIQAGQKGISITSVPIRTNADLRPSRLLKSIPAYLKQSILTIFRIFVVYKPFRFFVAIGVTAFTLGFLLGLRFLYYYFFGNGSGAYIQSLILASILLGIGFQTILVGFLADLQSVNRRLMEDLQYRIKKSELPEPEKKRKPI